MLSGMDIANCENLSQLPIGCASSYLKRLWYSVAAISNREAEACATASGSSRR